MTPPRKSAKARIPFRQYPWPITDTGKSHINPRGSCSHGLMGLWAQGPWALGPRAQSVLVLKTREADSPKCAFPRPLGVAV